MHTYSRSRTFGGYRFIFALIVSSAVSSGCGLAEKREAEERINAPVEVPDEVSLKADRSALDQARADVPEDVRRENDETAFVMGLMVGGTEEPSKVRSRFDKALRERRTKHDKSLRQERDEFTKAERRSREDFLKAAKDERGSFLAQSKIDKNERKRFFDDQDEARRKFFAEEHEKRKSFESSITEKRKTFEDYAREKQNHFNQEFRSYQSSYVERRKALELKKKTEAKARQQTVQDARRPDEVGTSSAAGAKGAKGAKGASTTDLSDWDKVPKGTGVRLAPGDE